MSHPYSAASHPDDLYLVNLYRSQLYLEHSELSTHSEAPPPSYDSDYSVQQITSQNRPLRSISITFSHFPDSTKKGYSNGDLIIGSLLIAPPFPINLESISISLEGEEVIRKSSWSYDQFLRRHIKLARHDFLNLPEDPVLLPNHLYTFPFSIEIPQIQNAHACTDLDLSASPKSIRQAHHQCSTKSIGFNHLKLPSTAGVHPNQSLSPLIDCGSKTTRVTYKLKPLVHGLDIKSGAPYSAVETDFFIKIFPSYPIPAQLLAPPPIPYSAFRQYSRKAHFSLLSSQKKSFGIVHLTTDKYPILPIYTRTPDSTKIALTVRYFPDQQSSDESPPPIHNVSFYVKARTVSSYSSSISKPVFDPANIKTYQVNNKLHDVIDPSKGLRANSAVSDSGAPQDSPNTTAPSFVPDQSKKKPDSPPNVLPDFKEEFKSFPIAFIDKFPSMKWHHVPPQESIVIPNFHSLIPATATTASSPINTKYKHSFFETKIVVPISLPSGIRGHDLVPSYESCYTARDYTLVISVEFSSGTSSGNNVQSSSSSNSPMGSPLVLEIPAVVVTSMTSAINTPDLFAYYADAATLVAEETQNQNQPLSLDSNDENSADQTTSHESGEDGVTSHGTLGLNGLTGCGLINTEVNNATNIASTENTATENVTSQTTNSVRQASTSSWTPRRGKKYLEVRPLPPKFGDTPPYRLKPSTDEENSLFGQYTINDYPFPPPGISLAQPNIPTTMMTTVSHYTGNQYHRIREHDGQYYPTNYTSSPSSSSTNNTNNNSNNTNSSNNNNNNSNNSAARENSNGPPPKRLHRRIIRSVLQ